MIVLALIFGYSILLNGCSIEAMYGRHALKLDLPGSALIPWVPWLTLAAYVLGVIAILRIKTPWKRWISFAVVTLLGHLAIVYPVELLLRESARIPLGARMNRESQQALAAKYSHVKWVHYSSSSDGTCIRVRRDEYTPELAAFVTGLVDRQPAPSNR